MQSDPTFFGSWLLIIFCKYLLLCWQKFARCLDQLRQLSTGFNWMQFLNCVLVGTKMSVHYLGVLCSSHSAMDTFGSSPVTLMFKNINCSIESNLGPGNGNKPIASKDLNQEPPGPQDPQDPQAILCLSYSLHLYACCNLQL